MLEEIVALAHTLGFHSVIARVSATQGASVALHRSCGFDLVGTEREVGRKFGRWIDVTTMQRLF
jgi:phosphinothricin acetyltransferase